VASEWAAASLGRSMKPTTRKQRFEIWIVTDGRQEKQIYLAQNQAIAFARRYNEHVESESERVRIERVMAYYVPR
jgi:hypothetical protein